MAHHWTSGILARRQAWHGLGRVLPDGFTFRDEDAEREGFTVERRDLVLNPLTYNGPHWQSAGVSALVTPRFVNPDGTLPIHGIVTDRYHIVQPSTVRLLVADMVDRIPGARAETQIVLRNGRDAVYCVDLGRNDSSGETYQTFLTVHSPYDGSTAVQVSATTVAVVCANTLQRAHLEHRIRIPHTKVVAREIEEALAVASSAVAEARLYGESLRPLVQARLNTHEEKKRAVTIAAREASGVYSLPEDPVERIKAERKLARTVSRIVDRVLAPQGRTDVRTETAYGILQATFDALEYTGRRETVRGSKLAGVLAGEQAEVQGRVERALMEVYA